MSSSLSLQQCKTAPEIALIFPPLVETNFGSYYPSIAVLAGYLTAKGIDSIQIDLNEDFASYLLKPESLERISEGILGDKIESTPSSMPAVAARLLLRYGHLLVDEQGKHIFREDSSDLAYLLSILAQPYRIDEPLSVITGFDFQDQPKSLVYSNFFKDNNYVKNLPTSLHIVGISIPVGPQLAPALILAQHLKICRPDLVIVLGGPAISLMAFADIEKVLLSHPSVDAVVRSDGERPLQLLLEQRRAGKWEPVKVPGVSCKVGDEIIHLPPEAGLELDKIPYAEYDPRLLSDLAMPEIGIVQSRGCYWGKCTYCDYIELYRGSPKLRTRSPSSFVDEMEYQVKKHKITKYSFITEAIAPASAKKISQLIIQRGLCVKWHSFAMVDKRFTPDVFETMVRAGCDYLVIGVETMTDRVLRLMRKSASREDTIKFILDAKASGLDIKVNLIPNLPSTTYQEAMESLSEFRRLQECFIYVSSFPFEVTRSSRIGREPGRFGLCNIDSNSATGQAQFTLNHIEVADPAMTAEELEQVFTEYHAFAAQVNNRGIIDTASSDLQEDMIHDMHFQLAEDLLDIIQVDERVQCYNWLTRKRFNMPAEWSAIIEKIRDQKSFGQDEFIRWFSSVSLGEFYFTKMLEKGIFTKYEPPDKR